ncbi:unnamed protein product [Umbelopsis ramanniana]
MEIIYWKMCGRRAIQFTKKCVYDHPSLSFILDPYDATYLQQGVFTVAEIGEMKACKPVIMEPVQKDVIDYLNSSVPSNASEAALSDLAKQFAELNAQLVSLTGQPKMRDPARQEPRSAGPRQFNENCYRCDQLGHRAAERPQPASSGNGQEQQ